MELDSLKFIWNEQEMPTVHMPDRSAVIALLQKKSQGPVARMRRNLAIELTVVILAYTPTILFYWMDFGGRLSPIGWLMLGIMIFFGFYYYRKDKILREMQCVQCEVRSNLERQVKTLQKYCRFYLLVGTFMIPAMVVLCWLIIRWQLPPAPGSGIAYRLLHPHWWASPLWWLWSHPWFWLLLLGIATVGSYYLNAWYIDKLYGRHVKKLRDLLQEMNEE
jgi:hypothetical protein